MHLINIDSTKGGDLLWSKCTRDITGFLGPVAVKEGLRVRRTTKYIWRERPSGLALRQCFSSPYIPQLVIDALEPANMGKVGNSSAKTGVFPSEALSL
jgi:hypothetical protein